MNYLIRKNTLKRLMKYCTGHRCNNCLNNNKYIAVHGCHLSLIKQFIGNNKTEILLCLKYAAIGGNIDVIDCIYNKYVNTKILDRDYTKYFNNRHNVHNFTDIVDIAGQYGKINVIKWFYYNTSEPRSENVMDLAAEFGHLNTLKWIHENNYGYCTEKAIDNASKNGYVDIIDWVYNNCTHMYTDALDSAIKNEHYDVVKWFSKNTTEKCSNNTLGLLVQYNNLDMLKWIYKNKIYLNEPWVIRPRWYVPIIDASIVLGNQEILDWIKSVKDL